MGSFTHIDAEGRVRMVDVGNKPPTDRQAVAQSIVVMQPETFDQIEVPKDILGDQAVYLQEGMSCQLFMHDGVAVSIDLPARVTLTVNEADPVVKGQTAAASYKPAITDNGLRVMVPPYISIGERIVVTTADGEFVERAKD